MVAIVVTGRGGAGKTTMTANLSSYFSSMGLKTLAVDGDLYLPKLAFHFGIYNPVTNIHTLLKEDSSLDESIYRDVRTGVDILPGSSKLYDVLDIDQGRLRQVVLDVRSRYDVTVIDSPVGIPFDTISTFRLAQYQLIVVEVERGPIHSFQRMVENEVEKLKALGEAYGLNVCVLLNKVREAEPVIDDVVEFLEGSFNVPVVGVVSYDPTVPASQNEGVPVLAFAPHAKASKDIKTAGMLLSERMFGKREKKGLWEKIKEAFLSVLHGTPSGKKL
ncbi:phosphodiesterase [Thermococcus eurythermalis]|uniref:Phosphodiesterase n=1 Tax=Thermococcus eurythermalis TaxID=1505907 RepID=A0A097QRK7_9EURY|nr:MinD/ParA family protein [Thermococcus eurythermalis]AIU69109.1 phosphodiesterase [Thermococcus eurythermalis]